MPRRLLRLWAWMAAVVGFSGAWGLVSLHPKPPAAVSQEAAVRPVIIVQRVVYRKVRTAPKIRYVHRSAVAAQPVARHRGFLMNARFPAMGTMVRVVAPEKVGSDAFAEAVAVVRAVFAEVEERLSRFLPESELSVVNTAAGERTEVSPMFASVLRLALDGAEETGGLFDPTILPALVAAGYDRDFDELDGRSKGAPPGNAGRWAEVELHDGSVRLPAGVALDFGGLAKGWAVDRAIELLEGLPWALVEAGGDLAVGGHPETLSVGVEDPRAPGEHLLEILLNDGALASSSVLRRRWGPGLHHLIDPRTQRPATTGVLQATVWAPTCAEAEVASKQALLLGEEALDRCPAVLLLDDGRVFTNVEADAR